MSPDPGLQTMPAGFATGIVHKPVARSHWALLHSSSITPVQSTGGPLGTQLPAPSQWSGVHRSPSASHAVLSGFGGLEQDPSGLQISSVHSFASAQSAGPVHPSHFGPSRQPKALLGGPLILHAALTQVVVDALESVTENRSPVDEPPSSQVLSQSGG